MRYTVVWTRALERDFADFWIAADSKGRRRATDVANHLDRELATSPDTKGIPVPNDPARRMLTWRLADASVRAVYDILPR